MESLKLTRSTGTLTPQEIETSKMLSITWRHAKLHGKLSDKPSQLKTAETSPNACKKQRVAELPGRSSNQLSHLERAPSNQLSCLQCVLCAPGSQFCELSPY